MIGKSKAGNLSRLWKANLDDHVIGLAWSPAGKRLACAAVGGPVKVFDGATGQVTNDLPGHGFGAFCVAWSADGAHLASSGQDGKVKLWDLAQNKERQTMQAGSAWVEKIAWCPTVNVLASAAGKKVRLWDAQGKMIRELPDHASTVADVVWQPRAEIFATTAYGQLFLWRLDSAEPYRRFEWKGSMLVLAWSPDGKYLATGDQDSTVHFWNVKRGEDLMMSGYPTKVRELSWDASSRYLATGGGTMPTVWDCSGKGPAGTTPLQLEAHTDRISVLAFQHSGPLLASAGLDRLVALWHPGRSDQPLGQEYLDSAVSQMAWGRDDKQLAVGAEDGTVAVYSLT